jgi:hypothetical protein
MGYEKVFKAVIGTKPAIGQRNNKNSFYNIGG